MESLNIPVMVQGLLSVLHRYVHKNLVFHDRILVTGALSISVDTLETETFSIEENIKHSQCECAERFRHVNESVQMDLRIFTSAENAASVTGSVNVSGSSEHRQSTGSNSSDITIEDGGLEDASSVAGSMNTDETLESAVPSCSAVPLSENVTDPQHTTPAFSRLSSRRSDNQHRNIGSDTEDISTEHIAESMPSADIIVPSAKSAGSRNSKRKGRRHRGKCYSEDDFSVNEQTEVFDINSGNERKLLYTCEKCQIKCITSEELSRHLLADHDTSVLVHPESMSQEVKEDHTDATNLDASDLEEYAMVKNKSNRQQKKTLSCRICGKSFLSASALCRHFGRHNGKTFQCDICAKTFTSQDSLNHHTKGVHNKEKPFKCTLCDASFSFKHSFKLHNLKHSGVRPHKCCLCMKTYLTANHLKNHMEAAHSDTKQHDCTFCGKKFNYLNSLKMHLKLHGPERIFTCSVCGQGFVSGSILKQHEKIHVDGKQFECGICGKKYKTEFLMRTHSRRHTSDGSRFMCDMCGRMFMFKSNLDAHAVIHVDGKSFQCTTCGKFFKTYATLYSHQYVHKTDNPYKCTTCDKAFKTRERCNAHEKRHLGLKPYHCTQCGKCFPDKGGWSKHTRTVHSQIKRFVCPVCQKGCSRADNLRVHMKVHGRVAGSVIDRTKMVDILPVEGEQAQIDHALKLEGMASTVTNQTQVSLPEILSTTIYAPAYYDSVIDVTHTNVHEVLSVSPSGDAGYLHYNAPVQIQTTQPLMHHDGMNVLGLQPNTGNSYHQM